MSDGILCALIIFAGMFFHDHQLNQQEQRRAIAALQRAYAAFNRGDIGATTEAMDNDIEWIEPAEFPGGGIYHGHAGVVAYLTQSRAGWAEGASQPEKFIPAGDKIVVFVPARIRPKGGNVWNEARLADVYTFRDGKVTAMRAFADRKQALEWAGVKEATP